MPSETASTLTEVLALLDLPPINSLSQDQVRGYTCVWDGIALTPSTAVDLGPRKFKRVGEPVSWFPRGCRSCTGTAAYRALLDHGPLCEQCVDNADHCQVGRGLRRLIREGRR
jgi:hypothetical protein